jgi:hypothetical protein
VDWAQWTASQLAAEVGTKREAYLEGGCVSALAMPFVQIEGMMDEMSQYALA